MGIPLQRGRTFESTDSRSDSSPVVIIDSVLAQELYPGEAAVGKSLGPWLPLATIVGVVGSIHEKDLGSPEHGAVYGPLMSKIELSDLTIVCRTSMSSAVARPAFRRVIAELDPELPIAGLSALPNDIRKSLGPRRVASALLNVFADTSLFLAILGVYGVLSYSISLRTRELGIRTALGARPGTLAGQVVGSGLRLAMAGAAIGIVVYLAGARVMSALVFGVSARDPVALVAGLVIVFLSVLAACYIPAHRASTASPGDALRAE